MTTAEFHILLALSDQTRHGLGIAKSVDESTEGDIRLGPGTLYRSLKQMVETGWISQVGPPSGEGDPRRRFYEITTAGRDHLKDEAYRFAKWVQLARESDVLPDAV